MSIVKNPARLITILTISILALFTMGTPASLSYAQSAGVMGKEVTLSGVVLLKDHLEELQKKLGSPACVIADTDHARTVYIYQGRDRSFFRFFLNTSKAHVDHDRINAMGMSNLMHLSPECQRSIPASGTLFPIQPSSQDGLRLGATAENITRSYGQPEEVRKEGSHIQMTYSRDQGYNHHLVWTFNFDNDHLTDWTVEAYPVFYELGG